MRDNPFLPRDGSRVKMTHEVAGLGGDVHFSKMEMLSQSFLEVYKDWVRKRGREGKREGE